MRCRILGAAVVIVLLGAVAVRAAADADRLKHVAVVGDRIVDSRQADEPVNPASVVKVATTLWALDVLGADHRYTTTFGVLGVWDRSTGVLEGDLVVTGGGDPDFQWENAYLVARELNRLGLRRVEGQVRIRGRFWFGWEHGVETRLLEPKERGESMGRRLIAALDPRRWDSSEENTWKALCERRGWDASVRPRVEVTGGVRVSDLGEANPLIVHRSNPLPDALRRFNVYSNNDIVRIADGLGDIDEFEAFVTRRLGLEAGEIEFSTASGERRNRMSVAQIARLLSELMTEAEEQELEPGRLLPVIGCDPGSTRRMFPALAAPALAGAVTCKTGTLTNTDGGVAVLAGTFTSPANGTVVFAVAAPRAGGRLQYWRQLQQRWLLALIEDQGGAVPAPCGAPLPFSDTFAEVEAVLGGAENR
jgi:D-alanyl-D-alanine carboxypeptidase/D-alanyl-D-alanine-endopeptidase (penicillin-binding protein 4)